MQTRLDFLTSSAVVALAPSMASPKPSSAPSPAATIPPLKFDVAAFDAALQTDAPHRHLFASTKIAEGLVLGQMRGVLTAYSDIGTSASNVRPVAVFYHGASVFLGFDDAVWNDFLIPIHKKATAPANEYDKDFATVYDAKTRGNPCLHKTGEKDDSSIESLVADSGAHFFVCNNAATGFSGYIARHLQLAPTDVYAKLAAHLVPNAMLVPAGIWAVPAIQERRYTYQQSTL